SAVGVDAGKRAGLAVHIVAGAAGTAQPTCDQRVHDHLVAFAHVGDRRPYRLDPAGVLVADRVRQLHTRLLRPLAFEAVHSGPAHPRTADLDHHVEWLRGLWYGHLLHLEVLVVADDLHGSHVAHESAPSFGTRAGSSG